MGLNLTLAGLLLPSYGLRIKMYKFRRALNYLYLVHIFTLMIKGYCLQAVNTRIAIINDKQNYTNE